MSLKVLLLDCSPELIAELTKQGFDVESGTVGFCNGRRELPCQPYECEIIIYNPSSIIKGNSGPITFQEIGNYTAEYRLDALQSAIEKGATCVVFLNAIHKSREAIHEAYKWIPWMPHFEFTKDVQIIPLVGLMKEWNIKAEYMIPLLSEHDVNIPVQIKMQPLEAHPDSQPKNVVWLFANKNHECLGVLMRHGRGKLIILPQYKSNDETIKTVLHRVIPRLYNIRSRTKIIDEFQSPDEREAKVKSEKIEKQINLLEAQRGEQRQSIETAKRKKENTIESDETAKSALRYYDSALQQDDVALYYLYKTVEVIENKVGGEKKLKSILKCEKARNYIGEVANASYGDMRHAPKPGEKIKEWSGDEIKECFTATKDIISAYLEILF